MTQLKNGRDQEKIPALPEEEAKKLDQAYRLADRPEEFAKLFCDVAENQTTVKKKIEAILKELLSNDIEANKSLKKIIQEVEKENLQFWFKTFGGKLMFGIWSLLMALVGGWAQSFFK